MKTTRLVIASVLASATLAAAPALAASETYLTEANHTFARFGYSHLGYSLQESRFDKVSGKIVIDRAAGKGSVDITIDTPSVSTGSAAFNEHIQGEDFLDTKQFPTATFKSSKLNFNGDKLASVDGTLTLKGVSKPVTLTVTGFQCMPHPMLKKDACGATAITVVKRTEFNAGKYAPYVGDDVTITVTVEAIKE